MKKPMPVPTPGSRPFWKGLMDRKVMLQRCRDCSHTFHYPRILCPQCMSQSLDWVQASGRGTLYTYTICRRPTHPVFADESPQLMAVVELEEGPRMTSTLVNVAEDEISIGMALEPVFERNEEAGITMLRFQPADTDRKSSPAQKSGDQLPADTLLTAEIISYIGRSSNAVSGYRVTSEEIRRFCYAADDLNPAYLDSQFSPQGIVAPPMFISVPFDWEVPVDELPIDGTPQQNDGLAFPPLPTKRKLFGGYEVEFFQHVRPGDVLTRVRKISDIYERKGTSGSTVFVIIEATYTNQNGDRVAVDTNTLINR